MLINCKHCNVNSDVIEVQELNDIKGFTDRLLIVGVCKRCNKDIAMLVETRMTDLQIFIDKFYDLKAKEVIKREKRRLKNKVIQTDTKYFRWIYGKNVEIKNKDGKVIQVRQYACDHRTNKRKLIKVMNETTAVSTR